MPNTHRLLKMSLCLASALAITSAVHAGEITTNATHMSNAPDWLNGTHVDSVVDKIQSKMEWDIHRVEVHWYYDIASYAKANDVGAGAIAFTRFSDGSVHLGPKVTKDVFDQVFGHEMVHVISLQKYKGAIPKWLEEGLANHLANQGKVDYKWLAKQPFPSDVKELVHPYSGNEDRVRYVYTASQALAEMISSKCDISDLLRMSVKRKLEDYLSKICNIDDINASYKTWVTSHSSM